MLELDAVFDPKCVRFRTVTRCGGRLRLRELISRDLERLCYINQRLFYPYMRHQVGPSGYLSEALSARTEPNRQIYYIGIVVDGQLSGAIDFLDVDRESEDAELGYFLLPEFEGQGFVTIAIGAVLEGLLNQVHLRQVTATVDPDNTRSLRLLTRLGFVPHGDGVPKATEYLSDPANKDHLDSRGRLTKRPRLYLRAEVSDVLAAANLGRLHVGAKLRASSRRIL